MVDHCFSRACLGYPRIDANAEKRYKRYRPAEKFASIRKVKWGRERTL